MTVVVGTAPPRRRRRYDDRFTRDMTDRRFCISGDDPTGHSLQHGQGVSAAGEAPAQLAHCHVRARHEDNRQPGEQAGDGRAVLAGRPDAHGPRETGSDPVVGQHRQRATVDAVRDRSPRASAKAGHTDTTGPARRRQPARPRGHVRADVHRGQTGGHRTEQIEGMTVYIIVQCNII